MQVKKEQVFRCARQVLFRDYLDKMEKVYRLSRGYNPVTGVEVDWSSEEKKDLLMVEGGDEVSNLFKYVGKVLRGDTYQQVWTR